MILCVEHHPLLDGHPFPGPLSLTWTISPRLTLLSLLDHPLFPGPLPLSQLWLLPFPDRAPTYSCWGGRITEKTDLATLDAAMLSL